MDTWILLNNIEAYGERNRGLYILKARGIAHSNQVREFVMTEHGIELIDAYVGSDGVLMGSARASQIARESAAEVERRQARQRKEHELERKRELFEAQLVAMKSQYEAEREALLTELHEDQKREASIESHRLEIARLRYADSSPVQIDKMVAASAGKEP